MIRGQTNVTVIIAGVSYRPPEQVKVDKAFIQLVEEASRLKDLVLVVDFNHLDICCKGRTAEQKQ